MATLVGGLSGPVNSHEREIIALLLDKLPGNYHIIPNLSLAEYGGAQVYEYDVVVVAPHAVYVVEAKGWYGTVRAVNRSEWRLSHGKIVANPHHLNDKKAKILATTLKGLDLKAPNGHSLKTPWVQGCFVAGNDQTVLEVLPEDQGRSLTPSDLLWYLRDPYKLPIKKTPFNKYRNVEGRIATFINGQRDEQHTQAVRRYGNYVLDETLDQDDEVSVFSAHHATLSGGQLYRVRTWFVSPYRYTAALRQKREALLRRSAEALSRLQGHPNVAAVVDFGEENSVFYEVTEWSDRGTLKTAICLGQLSTLSVERKLALLADITRGLEAAHQEGIYHRDLNPGTILLMPDGAPKLIDFDRAFLMDATQTVLADTHTEGHNPYRAPELRDVHDSEVFDNTDLYALGVIAFDLFTGDFRKRVPDGKGGFRLQRLSEAVAALGQTLPEAIVDDLDHFVHSLQAEATGERPTDPAEALMTFEELLERLKPTPPMPSKTPAEVPAEAPETTPDPKPTESAPEPDPVAERQGRGVFEPGEQIDAAHIVEGVLGRGANAVVYAVSHAYTRERHALKLYDPTSGGDPEALLREYRVLNRLSHPHVVSAHWGSKAPGRGGQAPLAYMTLERLDGPTLAARLTEGPLPLGEALDAIDKLLDALIDVHDVHVVHGDIKPENIVLTARGPVLTDFSAARLLRPGDDPDTTPNGTPRYTPPDLSTTGWGANADLFALGCVFYEALTGARPWREAPTDDDPMEAPHELVPSLSMALSRVVMRAIAPDHTRRFQDARAFQQALCDALDRPSTRLAATPDVQEAFDADRALAWHTALLDTLLTSEHPTSALYDHLRGALYTFTEDDARDADALERAWVAAETRAMALENPLTELMTSLYDALLTPAPPRPRGADDRARFQHPLLGDDDALLVIDGLAPFEVAQLAQHTQQADVSWREWSWVAAPALSYEPSTALDALKVAFVDPPPELAHCHDTSSAAAALADGHRAVRCPLPRGRRGDDGLAPLLWARRRALLDLWATCQAHHQRVWITTLCGNVYLGHGLRQDVGDGLNRADRVRSQWATTFGTQRAAAGQHTLPASVHRPLRHTQEASFVIGRLAWPDAPTAARLASDGLSLPERLLPLIAIDFGDAESAR